MSMTDSNRCSLGLESTLWTYGEEHIDLVLFDGFEVCDWVGEFFHILAFACKDGLIYPEAVALCDKQSTVGRNLVPWRQDHDITRNHYLGPNLDGMSISQNLGLVRRILR